MAMTTGCLGMFSGRGVTACALGSALVLALGAMPSGASAQPVTFLTEGFNDDGEAATPPRYTTVGRGVGTDGDGNLGFWAHSFDTGVDLGATFPAAPEGTGFFVGADLNNDSFGGGVTPRVLDLAPVDLTPWTDVTMTVALANGVPGDMWETTDFLRILLDGDNDGTFETTLADFIGGGNPLDTMVDQLGAGTIPGDMFADFEFGIPDDAAVSVIRFESLSSASDEILGIDNIRFAGVPEPSTVALLLLGAAAVGRRATRRRVR